MRKNAKNNKKSKINTKQFPKYQKLPKYAKKTEKFKYAQRISKNVNKKAIKRTKKPSFIEIKRKGCKIGKFWRKWREMIEVIEKLILFAMNSHSSIGMKLNKRIEEAAPAAQQLQELGRRLRCDDSGSEAVSISFIFKFSMWKINKTHAFPSPNTDNFYLIHFGIFCLCHSNVSFQYLNDISCQAINCRAYSISKIDDEICISAH